MHMFRRFGKKRSLALTALALLLLSAGAVAYFTATGSGSGTATVGTSSAITIHASTSGTLYPGTSESVTFTADNPSPGHQQVGTVHLSGIEACTGGTGNDSVWNPATSSCTDSANGGAEVPSCEDFDNGSNPDANASDFYMADVQENQDIAHGNGIALNSSGTLTMNDLSSSQNQCKNVNLYLMFTS
jgi:hypothetical protein